MRSQPKETAPAFGPDQSSVTSKFWTQTAPPACEESEVVGEAPGVEVGCGVGLGGGFGAALTGGTQKRNAASARTLNPAWMGEEGTAR